MDELKPSRTAFRVALRRAAHQLYDAHPLVFTDPFAIPILGPDAGAELQRTPRRKDRPHSASLRAWLVARSRFAEDCLAEALESGVTQYVLLGAGLDTFALRNPHPHLRVFEVDHPHTQAWKLDTLAMARLTLPASAHLVPVDFEREELAHALAAAGLDRGSKTMFAWLGVVPYLTHAAFRTTLEFIVESVPGSGVVFDYGQPRSALPLLEQLAHDSLASRVRMAGEPFQLFFTPEQMKEELRAFKLVEDLGADALNVRYFASRGDGLRILGAAPRLLQAWK